MEPLNDSLGHKIIITVCAKSKAESTLRHHKRVGVYQAWGHDSSQF